MFSTIVPIVCLDVVLNFGADGVLVFCHLVTIAVSSTFHCQPSSRRPPMLLQ